jgi:phage terminase large subunit-like protein
MTTLAPPLGVAIGPTWQRDAAGGWALPEHTIGWQAIEWTANYLLQPDGPKAGDPWDFTDEQMRFLLWWYAIDTRGRFVYRSGMLRRMKGWGKDPFGAALCCIEFVGPCRVGPLGSVPHHAAWVQTAAVSKDQTRNTMTLFPGMLSPRAIDEYGIDLGKEIIYAFKGRCRIEAVTSSPRALEGGRATFVLKNETHHWLTSNEGHDMAAVIARNAAKSRDGSSRVLAISNAHNPGEDSDAERDYDAYMAIATGRSRATGFLYDSLEAPPDVDLADDASLKAGIVAAQGGSHWLDAERLMDEIRDPRTPPSTSRRFYLNQIVATEDAWVSPQEWDACAAPEKVVEPGELITLGCDPSKSNDHTALVGCRVSDSHIFPLAIWEPENYADGSIPVQEIDDAVEKAFNDYDVVGFLSDVEPLEALIRQWEQRYGDRLCVRRRDREPIAWDMRGWRQQTTEAAQEYHSAIVEKLLTHAGDKRLDQYHYNARRRPNNYGVTFGKETMFSSRKVDGAAAAMLARRARQDYLALPESKQRQQKREAGVFSIWG